MTGYVTDAAGTVRRLPALLSWDLRHGPGNPCDAFEVRFLCGGGTEELLQGACRFSARENGETVFNGVVDEYALSSDAEGATAAVAGRGLAALLMDNEAEAAQYVGADLAFILRRHVLPWGITEIRQADMAAAGSFSVASGSSAWTVLEEFCRFCGGAAPRFNKSGVLLLDGSEGARRIFGGPELSALGRTVRRYGVISEVTVKNRGAAVTVENAAFKAAGGACRRVVNVPRRTGYDAMRYTGAYQIERSMEEAESFSAAVTRPFAAFAGDTVTLRDVPAGAAGEFRVRESRTRADAHGAETVLTLVRRDGHVAF